MSTSVLSVKNLHVNVADVEILHGINLEVGPGEIHVIMGPNGAGKSTLGMALMGHPDYEVKEGTIQFKDQAIEHETSDKRAQNGLFLSFQNPIEIQGLQFSEYLHAAVEKRRGEKISVWKFNKELDKVMDLLKMDHAYAKRDLNFGFSGGEKKKAEITQMLMLKPDLAILDETDSGLDVDAVRTVSAGVAEYMKSGTGSLIIITHSTRILESLPVTYTHILAAGKIIHTGGPELVEDINQNGFEKYLSV